MTKIKSMGKIVAVSVMSVIISISFNGCGFFKSTGNQALASLGSVAEQSVSNALSSTLSDDNSTKQTKEADSTKREKCNSGEEKNKNGIIIAKGKCKITGKEKCMLNTDGIFHEGQCDIGIKQGDWKYYDDSGYIVLREANYKDGLKEGIEKEYDKDENLVRELSYKNGKLNGTTISYNKEDLKNMFTKVTFDFVDGKKVIGRGYIDSSIAYFVQTKTENGVEITQNYNILGVFSKDLDKTLLPKLQAKYEKSLNDAIKKDGNTNSEMWKCSQAVVEVDEYNKGKTRIKPNAQTIKKAKECQNTPEYLTGIFNFALATEGIDGIEVRKVKEQIKKDYNTALITEFKKNSDKFSDDNKIIDFVKDKSPISETVARGTLKMITEVKTQGFAWAQTQIIVTKLFWYDKDSLDVINQWKTIGTINHNAKNAQNACVAKGSGNCRVFSRQFKELINKSAFKDTIYNLLPKPRNQ